MESFSVNVEMRGAAGPDTWACEEAIDSFVLQAGQHAGIASFGTRSYSARIFVDAPGPADAVTSAVGIVGDAARRAGLPEWPIVRTEAVREDILDEDNASPQWPDVVSGPEAAVLLGVSVQRVHQLAAGNPGFPRPVYKYDRVMLWHRAAIERFSEEWERKPGRPRKDRQVGERHGIAQSVAARPKWRLDERVTGGQINATPAARLTRHPRPD